MVRSSEEQREQLPARRRSRSQLLAAMRTHWMHAVTMLLDAAHAAAPVLLSIPTLLPAQGPAPKILGLSLATRSEQVDLRNFHKNFSNLQTK